MTKLATTLVVVLLMVNPAWAQDKKRYSDRLTIAGLTTVLVGAVLMVPMDDSTSKTYSFDSGSYCADTNTSNGNVSVTKGGCSDLPALRTAGLITMGVGGALTFIGLHKVAVKPQVGPGVMGAKVAIKW
jgi:hypothetical protein